jgi:hypothetical protein
MGETWGCRERLRDFSSEKGFNGKKALENVQRAQPGHGARQNLTPGR